MLRGQENKRTKKTRSMGVVKVLRRTRGVRESLTIKALNLSTLA